jgi:uncharacterized protein YecE (DUF72 family)
MSFYRFPFKNMLKGWYRKVGDGFKMTFKANRLITHRKKFKDVEDVLRRFYDSVAVMDDKTGALLFQTPPSMKKNRETMQTLSRFLQQCDRRYPHVMEFRDPSWWDEETYALLREHDTGFCVVSGLDMPDDVVVCGSTAYFRFHGPGDAYASCYGEEQIDAWADTIATAVKKYSPAMVFCYFNNDDRGYAVQNARQLCARLRNDGVS